MWNKIDYALKDLQKLVGQLEDFSDSKWMQGVLNGSNFKCHFGGGWFSYASSVLYILSRPLFE